MAVGARGVRFWPRMGRHVFEEEKKEAAQVVDDLLKTATKKDATVIVVEHYRQRWK